MKYVVAPVSEIPPGYRKIVEVARRSIGIFNLDGEFFALRNRCPHQGGPLCEGRIWGPVTAAAPGEFDYKPTRHILSCPWHGWEFDIRTGRSWCEPDRLRTGDYPVDVLSGRQVLADTHEVPGRVAGPFQAEHVDVRLEGEYVVVELR